MKDFITNNSNKISDGLKKNNSLLNNKFLTFISFILILIIWKIVSIIISSSILLPSPEVTFLAFLKLIKTKFFYLTILSSLYRGIIGFLISFLFGLIFGFLAGFNKKFFTIFEPILIIIRTTPVIAVILIALIWFKAGNVPIFASFLMSFPIICTNIIEGIKNIDLKIIQMAKIYEIKKSRIFFEIYLPSLAPFITSAVSTAFGIGWKVIIASEVLSQPRYAIGTSLQTSKIYLNIDEVFAWTFIAVFFGYIFEKIIRFIEFKTIKWKKLKNA